MRTIAVVNQKGGCGKTITSINLSAFLAYAQRRVLLVDMDPQGHASLGLLADYAGRPTKTMYEVLSQGPGKEGIGLRDVIVSVRDNLDVAPADVLLSAIPEMLAGVAGRENMLADALAEVRRDYDYVIVDCPPNVGLLTFNALKACSEAIVPMDPSFFSLHGIAKLLETFDVLSQKSDHHIEARVLVTLYPGRSPFREGWRRLVSSSSRKPILRNDHQIQREAGRGRKPRSTHRRVLPSLCGVRGLPGAGGGSPAASR